MFNENDKDIFFLYSENNQFKLKIIKFEESIKHNKEKKESLFD